MAFIELDVVVTVSGGTSDQSGILVNTEAIVKVAPGKNDTSVVTLANKETLNVAEPYSRLVMRLTG
jgi:hypothetical protein